MIFMKYRDYAGFCADKKEFEEAITYYQKTIAIEEELLKEDFETFCSNIQLDNEEEMNTTIKEITKK